jgi:hypothetical protein
MTSGFGYKIVPEHQLVLEHFVGKVGLNDIVFSEMKLFENPDFVAGYSAIIDFRDCELTLSKSDLEYIINSIKEMYGDENTRQVVHIVSKPTETALALMFSNMMVKDEHFASLPAVVSTIQGAADNLPSLPLGDGQLIEWLAELKQITLAGLDQTDHVSNTGFACVIH